MKLCTIKALLNEKQNKKNQKSDLRRQNDVIIKKKQRENSDLRETKQMIYHLKGNDETDEPTRKIFQSHSFLPTKKQ